MIVCAMQPYLFPYLPYYQLAAAVDAFWVLDDVQYTRRGWMNRNRILRGGAVQTITFPVAKGAQSDRVADKRLATGFAHRRANLTETVRHAYRHAPHGAEAVALLRDLPPGTHFLDLAMHALRDSFAAMGVTTPLHCASTLALPDTLRGQDRIIALCHATGATTYVNPIGGQALYDRAAFQAAGIDLRFLNGTTPPYAQPGTKGFVPGLSILDLIAHVAPEGRNPLLRAYSFID